MYTTVGICYSFQVTLSCPGWIGTNPKQDNRQSLKKNNKYNCCTYTVVPPDDGPRQSETCRGLRKILRISCASSWFFFTQELLTLMLKRFRAHRVF